MTVKFRIKRNERTGQYYWNLKDDNGETIANHEMYESKQACKEGIVNVVEACSRAFVLDESGDLGTHPEVPLDILPLRVTWVPPTIKVVDTNAG